MLVHKGCGGEVIERRDEEPYLYDSNEDGVEEKYYPWRCVKCGQEIGGDAQLDIVIDDEDTYNPFLPG